MQTIILIVLTALISACVSVGAYHILLVRRQAKERKNGYEHEQSARELDLMLRL